MQSKAPTLFTPVYVRVLLVQMAFGLSYSAFLLLPKYLRVELDASASVIGWVNGTALVAAAALSPVVGFAARLVSRKHLLAGALVVEGTAALGFALTERLGFWVYVLRALQGLSWVIVFNCTAMMATESVPTGRMAQAIGYLGVAMLGTNALAPIFTEPMASHFGWAVAFGLPAIFVFAAITLVPGLPTTNAAQAQATSSAASSPSSLACYYASFMMGCGIGVMFTFTQPFALELGADRVGDFFIGYVLAAVFVRVALASVADRLGPARVATAAIALYGVVVVATSELTPSLLPVIGAGLGVAHGFLYPALTATGLSPLAGDQRAVFMGWFACAFNTGYALTALSLGRVADSEGYPMVFALAGIAIATGTAPLLLTARSRRVAASQTG